MKAVVEPPTVTECPLADRYVGRRYVRLVLVLGALTAIGPLTVDTYLPALPALRAYFGATDVQAQATLTGLLIGLGLGQLIIGPLSDAVGAPAATAGGASRARGDVGALRSGADHHTAGGRPQPPGRRRRRRRRGGDGHRA